MQIHIFLFQLFQQGSGEDCILGVLFGVLCVLFGVLGVLFGVLGVLFGVLGVLFGVPGVLVGVLGVWWFVWCTLHIFCRNWCFYSLNKLS